MEGENSLKRGRSVKILSLLIVLLTILIFIWYVFSDRRTPNTDQARVKGLVLPIAPMVSGYVTKVNVTLHSEVNKGDTLFIIDQKNYKLAVDAAEVNLEKILLSLKAGSSSIKAATARVSKTKVQLHNATRNWERTKRVIRENKGALSEADRDRSETAYLEAIEHVASAEANLQKEKDALGPTDSNNPNLKAGINQLEQARLNLAYTVVTAPSNGIIESFDIEEGYFAGAGRPLVSLVSNKDIWIQANLKENNLSNIKRGDEVDIIFDIQPGDVFKGKITSIAYGVSTDRTNKGNLPKVTTSQGWLRDPQRFPVIIEVEDIEIKKKLRQGSQAEVVVYTGDNPLLNFLAKTRIEILSELSYVR
ncbi:P-hydroxybenzoic acid efflux pump subunit AaeA [Flavobacteriaceae bacterium UJ101]|nr:P-hydroxybenzoic acid efflux pump subunit AaeA [Flavobacteriaceae bacterium UJ101]